MTPATVFDRMAADYDATWTAAAVGSAQRDQVWRVLDAMFARGSRVLDVGCGTGEDARHLMGRGVAVQAIDASPAMVAIAQAHGVTAEVRCAEELGDVASETERASLAYPPGKTDAGRMACPTGGPEAVFDGALSNFGALNCVADLAAAARGLARVVRPGGPVAICLIGRCCLWEIAYYSVRLQFRKALRRRHASEFRGMAVYYPSVAEVSSAFAEGFELRRWKGVGLFVPPSYVKLPATLVRALGACDRVFAGLPGLRAMADHRLFVLVKQ